MSQLFTWYHKDGRVEKLTRGQIQYTNPERTSWIKRKPSADEFYYLQTRHKVPIGFLEVVEDWAVSDLGYKPPMSTHGVEPPGSDNEGEGFVEIRVRSESDCDLLLDNFSDFILVTGPA